MSYVCLDADAAHYQLVHFQLQIEKVKQGWANTHTAVHIGSCMHSVYEYIRFVHETHSHEVHVAILYM